MKLNRCHAAVLFVGLAGVLIAAGPSGEGPSEKVLFVSNRDSDLRLVGIYATNPDGSQQRRISPPDAYYDFDPALSPDGRRIAFSAPNGNDDYAISIWVMDVDGRNRRKLTDGTEMACAPVWSPDGTRIAFCDMNTWTGNMEVFVTDADGRNHRKLADGVFPFWSPDGKRIAYAAGIGGEKKTVFQLRVVAADGGASEVLIHGGFLMGDWSPDGRQIVYLGAGGPEGPNFDLYIANADGTGRRQLADTPQVEFSPQWSADGNSIYFVRFPARKEPPIIWSLGQGERAEIHAIDADGRNERRLTENDDFDFLRGGAFVIGMSHPITPKGGNDFYPPARRSGEQRKQGN